MNLSLGRKKAKVADNGGGKNKVADNRHGKNNMESSPSSYDTTSSIPEPDSLEFNELKAISSCHNSVVAMKPGSKVKRLKRMLQEAEEKRNRLQALQQQGVDGVEKAKQEVWSDVLIDASGSKSVTDTKKLKKALKKIEKSKEKSTIEWQARMEAVEESKAAQQEHRETNLKARKEGRPVVSKIEENKSNDKTNVKSKSILPSKTQHKHVKQSDKNRPGFEGKKKVNSDFLNHKSK